MVMYMVIRENLRNLESVFDINKTPTIAILRDPNIQIQESLDDVQAQFSAIINSLNTNYSKNYLDDYNDVVEALLVILTHCP